MEATIYKVTDPNDETESWSFYLRHDSMSPAEQEVARESNLRARAGGYTLRRDALEAAKIDAKDIRRAARVKAEQVS